MANNRTKKWLSTVATLLVIGAIGGVYALFFAPNTNKYLVYYSNVKGLQASSPVVQQGVRIGKIKDITLEKSGLVKVVVEVNEDITLHQGAKASLTSVGVLGDKSIIIIDGTSTTILKNGAVLTDDLTAIQKSSNQTTVTDINTVKAKLHFIDSTLQFFNDSSISSLLVPILAFYKNIGEFAAQSGNVVEKSSSFLSRLNSIAINTSNLRKSSTSFSESSSETATSLDKLNNTPIRENVDTIRNNIRNLSSVIKKAAAQLPNEKVYTNTSKQVKSLDTNLKEYHKRPKGFSILGKSK